MSLVVRLGLPLVLWSAAVLAATVIVPSPESARADVQKSAPGVAIGRPDTAQPPSGQAGEAGTGSQGGMCMCPGNGPGSRIPDKDKIWPKPKIADLRPTLEASDHVAALEAIQLALSEVGDGSTYVWHAKGGRVSGTVKPVASFRNGDGKICRRIETSLSAGVYSKSTTGTACRDPDGIWSLEG